MLCPYFQQIVGSPSLHLEALIRQETIEGNVLLPADFLPQMETDGRLSDVFFTVLHQSCALINALSFLETPAPQININLDRQTLERPFLTAEIKNILEENAVSPSQIKLEIKEDVFIENINKHTLTPLFDTLKTIQNMGIPLCMDDFGTGASTGHWYFEMEKRGIHIHTIKLDGSLMPSNALNEQTLHAQLKEYGFYEILRQRINSSLSFVLEKAQKTDVVFYKKILEDNLFLQANALSVQSYRHSMPESFNTTFDTHYT